MGALEAGMVIIAYQRTEAWILQLTITRVDTVMLENIKMELLRTHANNVLWENMLREPAKMPVFVRLATTILHEKLTRI
tara:strand:- start:185 stop:421 length:237 start_codon:yes stop_codon:yes gene_type:complete